MFIFHYKCTFFTKIIKQNKIELNYRILREEIILSQTSRGSWISCLGKPAVKYLATIWLAEARVSICSGPQHPHKMLNHRQPTCLNSVIDSVSQWRAWSQYRDTQNLLTHPVWTNRQLINMNSKPSVLNLMIFEKEWVISQEKAKQQRQHHYDLQLFATAPIDSPLTHTNPG